MKIKKEFLSLKQDGMSVADYRDKFTELSRYATEEVDEDKKKQEMFLDTGVPADVLSFSHILATG
jgi:predicted RNA-binding protein (virulence factor B family)